MEPELLSRIQFGVAIGIHYLFPISTLGLIIQIVFFQTLSIIKKNPDYATISSWLTAIFAPLFICGVATGLLMPFMIGTGWSRFSVFSGEMFGSIIAIESAVTFTMESVFLGVMIFGKNKVSPKAYLFSAVMVLIGSHLSTFFIVAANSWMQTPAGFVIEGGRVMVTSLWDGIFNASTISRFLHVILAAWLTGAIIVCALAANNIIKKKAEALSKKMLTISIIVFMVISISQLLSGHEHILNVFKHQPTKAASYEGLFKSEKGAPLYIAGIPDMDKEKIHFGIKIPYLLSFLMDFNPKSEVKGLENVPKKDWPNINIIFTTFHIMVGCGMLMIGFSILGVFLLYSKKLFNTVWYLKLFPPLVIIPFLANQAGWISTEIGRQPWLIYGVLKTSDSYTLGIGASSILTMISINIAIFLVIAISLTMLLRRIIEKGLKEGVK